MFSIRTDSPNLKTRRTAIQIGTTLRILGNFVESARARDVLTIGNFLPICSSEAKRPITHLFFNRVRVH